MSSLYPPSDDVIACCEGLRAEEISAHVTLSNGLGQRWGGETALVFSQGRVWVVTRGSILDPWKRVEIARGSLSLVLDGWQHRLHMRGADGTAYEVEVSSFKAEDLTRALQGLDLGGAAAAPSITGGLAHGLALGLLKVPQRLILGALKATQAKLLQVLRAKARKR